MENFFPYFVLRILFIYLFIFRCSDRILCREDKVKLEPNRGCNVVRIFVSGRRYIDGGFLQRQHLVSVRWLYHNWCDLPDYGYYCKVNFLPR